VPLVGGKGEWLPYGGLNKTPRCPSPFCPWPVKSAPMA